MRCTPMLYIVIYYILEDINQSNDSRMKFFAIYLLIKTSREQETLLKLSHKLALKSVTKVDAAQLHSLIEYF
jgi:hypothetical protein